MVARPNVVELLKFGVTKCSGGILRRTRTPVALVILIPFTGKDISSNLRVVKVIAM